MWRYYRMKVGDKILCKRTLTIETTLTHMKFSTEGKMYEVVKVSDGKWFWTINDDGLQEAHCIYASDDETLPRTYKKWFYTPQQTREMKLKRILLSEKKCLNL